MLRNNTGSILFSEITWRRNSSFWVPRRLTWATLHGGSVTRQLPTSRRSTNTNGSAEGMPVFWGAVWGTHMWPSASDLSSIVALISSLRFLGNETEYPYRRQEYRKSGISAILHPFIPYCSSCFISPNAERDNSKDIAKKEAYIIYLSILRTYIHSMWLNVTLFPISWPLKLAVLKHLILYKILVCSTNSRNTLHAREMWEMDTEF